ncbi:MAG: hypothetical protein ABIE07_04315 [Candidatus Zixiibacteriota bacterium]
MKKRFRDYICWGILSALFLANYASCVGDVLCVGGSNQFEIELAKDSCCHTDCSTYLSPGNPAIHGSSRAHDCGNCTDIPLIAFYSFSRTAPIIGASLLNDIINPCGIPLLINTSLKSNPDYDKFINSANPLIDPGIDNYGLLSILIC